MKRRRLLCIVFTILLFLPENSLARTTLKLLIIPLDSPSVMYKRFLPLKDYLQKKLNVNIELGVAKKSSMVIKALKDGTADIAYLCPTLYVEARDGLAIEPIVKLRVNGSSYYRSVILVREDSKIKRTIELSDGSFVFGRYACPGSGLLPEIMLKHVGITEENMIDMVKLGSDQSALTAVLARMFDATAVSEMMATSYIGRGLRVLRYSYSIPQYLFVARSSLGSKWIGLIRKAFLSVNRAKESKEIFKSIEKGVEGFDPAYDHDYDIVRVLMNTINPERDYYSEDKGYIKLYVEPVYFEPEIFVKLNPLIDFLLKKINMRVKVIVLPKIMDFIQIQKVDEPALFLENHFLSLTLNKRNIINPISSVTIKGLTEPTMGLIIVRNSSNIRDLRSLQELRIGVPSRYSEAGYIAQINYLKHKGIDPESLDIKSLGTYEKVLVSLYKGEIDAAFVSLSSIESIKDDMDIRKFRTIASVPVKNNWLINASKGIKGSLITRLKRALQVFNMRSQRTDLLNVSK